MGLRPKSKTWVGETRRGNPKVRVGQVVIDLRCSENTTQSRAWLDTAKRLVNSGKGFLGRNSDEPFSAYKDECSKLFEKETGAKLDLFKS